MSVLSAGCPSCGAPIEFKKGSTLVIVCPYCRSAVARTDRSLEDLGKVAEIADSSSPLKLGLKGEYMGNRFELTGRAQLRHEAGGFWDEWYANFSNGWVGWLAEAQGRFYMTFFQPVPEENKLPSYDELQPGEAIPSIAGHEPFTVIEKGVATSVAAEGEIPYQLIPNEQTQYADLGGKNNAFGTIDYSVSPPWLFVGKQVTLDEIGLGSARPVQREARRTTAAAMGCPQCGGPLSLIAPDKTERVACPNCSSLLDVDNGNLKYLRSISKCPTSDKFVLKIGSEGLFPGDVKFKVIGAMVRSVTIEGIQYFWHEYLLYNPMVGFRWLVHSDNHWNFVEPVNPADVTNSGYYVAGSTVKYNGRSFKIFQDAKATVDYVTGEFYWKVSQGESVRAVDYVSAPLMLSQERAVNEVNWSVGVYMTNAEIEKAFGIKGLPKPWSVAPNQPFTGRFAYTWGLLPLFFLLFVSVGLLPLTGISTTVVSQQLSLPPMTNSTQPQVAFSNSFEIKANRNVRITASAPVNNSWADLDVDLVNDQSQEVESVNIPIEYYTGVDSDGSWSEGGQTQDATMSSLPPGNYTLRIEGSWQDWQKPMPISFRVEQGVNRGVNFICALIVLLIFPILGLIRKISFESKRWSESMFGSTGDDD
ncbi:MAG: DUF4178 domain-containing protein [Acidobacteria bacterium]|nr:DUF4178 domain-containing protein [Acidobacteriota bacterium]